jgi:hypothetical protein
MSISGGRFDTVMDNVFTNNGAWGIVLVPFPDSGPPCTGGVRTTIPVDFCLYDDWGIDVRNNTFTHNGFFGNPSNGDIAELQSLPTSVNNCLSGNTDTAGSLTVSPAGAQTVHAACDGLPNAGTTANAQFLTEVACDSGADIGPATGTAACLPSDSYPRHTAVVMHALPHGLASMANPCAGIPANPWCPSTSAARTPSTSLPSTGTSPLVAVAGLAILAVAGTSLRLRRGRRQSTMA